MLQLTSNVVTAFSISHLFAELCQPICRGPDCSAFGPFVFLPTFHRCCEDCLRDCHQFQVMPISFVGIYFDITLKTVAPPLCPSFALHRATTATSAAQ